MRYLMLEFVVITMNLSAYGSSSSSGFGQQSTGAEPGSSSGSGGSNSTGLPPIQEKHDPRFDHSAKTKPYKIKPHPPAHPKQTHRNQWPKNQGVVPNLPPPDNS